MTLNSPFYLIEEETGSMVSELLVNIKTGESLHIKVLFSTLFKKDTHNDTINGCLTICYAEHQHNDQINLVGEIFFPNIYLETNNIDFGCILNNTEVCQDIKMTNIGPLVVHYKWKFVIEKDNIISNRVKLNQSRSTERTESEKEEQEEQLLANHAVNEHRITSESNLDNGDHQLISNIMGDAVVDTTLNSDKIEQIEQEILDEHKLEEQQPCLEDVMEAEPKQDDFIEKVKSNKLEELLNKAANIDLPSIEEIFDISPLYGCLYPGEAQKLKVTYFGHKEIKAFVRAVCEVTNGPNYELLLKGEASVLNYEISSHTIDFDYIVSLQLIL